MAQAVILDVDGVLTSTATVHERAWKLLFDEVLAAHGDPRPFGREEYLAHVDGKPREDGLRDLLVARGLQLEPQELRALAERKNAYFLAQLERDGVQAYEDAAPQLKRWREGRLRIAFVSSSRNAQRVLSAAGLAGLCDVRVDGETAEQEGLRGKPDLFREAARRLGVALERAVVIEDSVAGVAAARREGFGTVIGVDRSPTGAHREALLAQGAHRIVQRLDELGDLGDPAPATATGGPDAAAGVVKSVVKPIDAWTLRFDGWNPAREGLREALCTLGNGNFATRGAAEEASADGVHYPGTYLAGGYDRIASEIAGELLVNEDLVNWPNWLRLSFRPRGGEWLLMSRMEVLELTQELDLRRGVLQRRVRVRDRKGRETLLRSHRFVSMASAHLAALSWELVPLNWEGPLELHSALDGTVGNEGVARYRQLRAQHLEADAAGGDEPGVIWLAVHSRQSHIRMAQAARTRVEAGGAVSQPKVKAVGDRVTQCFEIEARRGEAIRVEKIAVLVSSRDPAISEPLEDARGRIGDAADFAQLLKAHEQRWAELWQRCDIQLGPSRVEENRNLRLHIFHLLQVVSPHIIHRDVGVPARGLHGEAYRGHVFWDELFIFPYLNFRIPELTRELLMYRYLRLDEARRLAREAGFEGAAFPWQSGSSGREESQRMHLNPRSGRWTPDETSRQRHISAAVAWNVWHYFEVTGDRQFLAYYGAELILEVARYWASVAEWDASLQRYRIRAVVGPDEFHTAYPDASSAGIDDNAYTNVMASWCLRTAERALDVLGAERRCELLGFLGLGEDEVQRWQAIARGLRVVFTGGGRIISQFDGYDALEELDWEAYRARHGDLQRLDRILEAEGTTPNRFKVSKQADVLMLFFVLTPAQIVEQMEWMGYPFERSAIRENIDYYLRRTTHGSTLSSVLHSWVLARVDRANSWRLFAQALQADVGDVQRGTTAEGIHLGAMASTVDLAQRGYTGAEVRDDVLWLDPQLPDELSELSMRLRFRSAWIEVGISDGFLSLELTSGETMTAKVGVRGDVHVLRRGERRRFML